MNQKISEQLGEVIGVRWHDGISLCKKFYVFRELIVLEIIGLENPKIVCGLRFLECEDKNLRAVCDGTIVTTVSKSLPNEDDGK